MTKKRGTICLDFDGVVHSYTSGWKGARRIVDPPVDGALNWIIQALSFYRVAIHSSRGSHWGGRRAMRNWLRFHGEDLWYPTPSLRGLEDVEFPRFKPPALVTIDDRAIIFNGTFPSMKDLETFTPWNKT